ncbi:unnamed protein product [Sphenostylis stenocarpa]|uniref:TF-B3 domain-containing protein n=1 Tax=Sphenostylis stenocarpa TaxID=92480 RepID=A0AA86W3D5_9FABA|nr:unnamed protein product [Sphenostylis stenocarpa]
MPSDRHCGFYFAKKIEEYTLQSGELRIPRRIVSRWWEGMSNPVLFVLPNGDKWEMKWKKSKADLWLVDDWKKFAEFYSLDLEHQLVCKYLGKSQLEVAILDQSGGEIFYPLREGASDGEGNIMCQIKRGKSPLQLSLSSKKMKTIPKTEPSCSQEVKTNREINIIRITRGSSSSSSCSKSMTNAVQSEGQSALERAQAFRSHNPFFIREMKPSYINILLVIPTSFGTDHVGIDGKSIAIGTSDSGDKTWLVKFCVNSSNGQSVLTTGWRKFVKENNLKVGDVCVFEQIKSPAFSLRVHIFRHGEETNPTNFSDLSTPKNILNLCLEDLANYFDLIPLK